MLQTFFISSESSSFNLFLPNSNIFIFMCCCDAQSQKSCIVNQHCVESFHDEEAETAACKFLIAECFERVVLGFVLQYTSQLKMSSITGKSLVDLNMNVVAISNTNLQDKEK